MLIEKTERSRRLTESAFLRKLAGKLHRMEKGAVAPAAGSDAERRALAGFVRQLTAGDEAWVRHLGEDPQYIAGAGPDDDFALIADGVRDGALFQRLVGIALRDTELSSNASPPSGRTTREDGSTYHSLFDHMAGFAAGLRTLTLAGCTLATKGVTAQRLFDGDESAALELLSQLCSVHLLGPVRPSVHPPLATLVGATRTPCTRRRSSVGGPRHS